MDLLSCDNPEDAIRSLSLIYGVDREKIEQVFLGHWPDFVLDDLGYEIGRASCRERVSRLV